MSNISYLGHVTEAFGINVKICENLRDLINLIFSIFSKDRGFITITRSHDEILILCDK